MDEKKLQKLYEALKNEPLIQKHMRKYTWLSGSSTIVYPIMLWKDEASIQLDTHKNIFNKFIKRFIEQHSDLVVAGHFNQNDGSCPPELTFWYNISKTDGNAPEHPGGELPRTYRRNSSGVQLLHRRTKIYFMR